MLDSAFISKLQRSMELLRESVDHLQEARSLVSDFYDEESSEFQDIDTTCEGAIEQLADIIDRYDPEEGV